MTAHFLKNIAFAAVLGFTLVCASAAFAQYPGFGDPGSRSSGGGDSGGLAPVMPKVDGGKVPVGATAQVVVRFRNEGSQPVETGLIRLYPSSTVSGEVALNQCQEGALPPGAECAIAISVKALQAGAWRMEMLMSHSGRSRLVTATLAGLIESGSKGAKMISRDIETVPSELNFGSLEDTQTLIEPVILRNITSKPISVTDIYIDTSEQAGYTLKTECDVLEAGQACMAVVTWSPKLAGRSSGVLVVNHSGPSALASVPLKGIYEPQDVEEAEIFPKAVPGRGLLVSSQSELDFGGDVETASTITVSLVNAGDVDLNIENISIAGTDNGLSFKEEGCAVGTVLAPIEACPLTLTWSPSRIGALFDDIQIQHDGARGVLVLPVRGQSLSAVSQDQRAIVLSGGNAIISSSQGAAEALLSSGYDGNSSIESQQQEAEQRNVQAVSSNAYRGVSNPAGVLDGYKITSFSPTRAIINGPGGSRLVFDNEEIVLGGVPWFVLIQKSGIEFLHHGQRVLLLFDRSLSSINRVSSASGAGTAG